MQRKKEEIREMARRWQGDGREMKRGAIESVIGREREQGRGKGGGREITRRCKGGEEIKLTRKQEVKGSKRKSGRWPGDERRVNGRW